MTHFLQQLIIKKLFLQFTIMISKSKIASSKTKNILQEQEICFGSVKVMVTVPSKSILKKNIQDGVDALKRAKKAILKPGIKLPKSMDGIEIVYGNPKNPETFIKEKNGIKTEVVFKNGKFKPL